MIWGFFYIPLTHSSAVVMGLVGVGLLCWSWLPFLCPFFFWGDHPLLLRPVTGRLAGQVRRQRSSTPHKGLSETRTFSLTPRGVRTSQAISKLAISKFAHLPQTPPLGEGCPKLKKAPSHESSLLSSSVAIGRKKKAERGREREALQATIMPWPLGLSLAQKKTSPLPALGGLGLN